MSDLIKIFSLLICIFMAVHTSLIIGLIQTGKANAAKYSLALMSASYSALALCYFFDNSCAINPYVSYVIISTGMFFAVLFITQVSLTKAIDKE